MFFVVYKGKGLVVVYSLFLCIMFWWGASKLLGLDTEGHSSRLFMILTVGITLLLPGIICVALGLHARLQPARRAIDRKTGRERIVRPIHSLYWIRVEYWGAMYVGAAAWLFTTLARKPV